MSTQLFPTRFPVSSPVWLLGTAYGSVEEFLKDPKVVRSEAERSHLEMICRPRTELLHEFNSRLYFSYRQDFDVLPDSDLSSDVGWGCMLRVGQMLLAQTLIVHLFKDKHSADVDSQHRQIVRMFDDKPSCRFSLHNLLQHLRLLGVRPGDWLGPSTVSRALCEAINGNFLSSDGLALRAYHVPDCQLSIRAVTVSGAWTPVLILIPLRLGLRGLSECYYEPIKALFHNPLCVGIMGGRPRHALYFMGIQDDDFVALDPHVCRPCIDTAEQDFSLETFRCEHPKKISLRAVDPSLCLGFYCYTYSNLTFLLDFLQDVLFSILRSHFAEEHPRFHPVGVGRRLALVAFLASIYLSCAACMLMIARYLFYCNAQSFKTENPKTQQ